MGYGVPYPGVALPRSVSGIVYGLQHYSGVPNEQLEWHGHNDFYKSVVNASTAWLYGASAVNCSLFGIGERTGNIPLEAMIFEYASLKGTLDGMDTRVITELADYFTNEIGYQIPNMTPFVGKHFNTTRAGIHADGLDVYKRQINTSIYILRFLKLLQQKCFNTTMNLPPQAAFASCKNGFLRA